LIDSALRIDVTVKGILRYTSVHQLDTAYLDDAMAGFGLEPGSLCVQNHLSHGGSLVAARAEHRLRLLSLASTENATTAAPNTTVTDRGRV